jgi:hypothetical protein
MQPPQDHIPLQQHILPPQQHILLPREHIPPLPPQENIQLQPYRQLIPLHYPMVKHPICPLHQLGSPTSKPETPIQTVKPSTQVRIRPS